MLGWDGRRGRKERGEEGYSKVRLVLRGKALLRVQAPIVSRVYN